VGRNRISFKVHLLRLAQHNARRKRPERPASGRRLSGLDDCLVLVRDRGAAYITSKHFQANQGWLAAYRDRHGPTFHNRLEKHP